MRVALDTNVLAYAEGVNSADKRGTALRIVRLLPQRDVAVPVQVLGELFNVLVRKAGRNPEAAGIAILNWRDAFPTVETSVEVMLAAADLAGAHRLSIWDAVILSAAAEAGCRLLLSEDMQEGFTWRGVTVTNPFTPTLHPLLAPLLSNSM